MISLAPRGKALPPRSPIPPSLRRPPPRSVPLSLPLTPSRPPQLPMPSLRSSLVIFSAVPGLTAGPLLLLLGSGLLPVPPYPAVPIAG